MEVLEAIRTRRSIRKYRPEPVPEEKLEQILDAGRWAPMAHYSQSWKFIVLRDRDVLSRLAQMLPYGKFLPQAPLSIAVVVDPEVTNHPLEDGSLAAGNMFLAAHALGLGGCWVDPTSVEAEVKQMLNIPPGNKLICLIPVGYADEAPVRGRKELKDIVYNDHL